VAFTQMRAFLLELPATNAVRNTVKCGEDYLAANMREVAEVFPNALSIRDVGVAYRRDIGVAHRADFDHEK
jgi:hypothetical protein